VVRLTPEYCVGERSPGRLLRQVSQLVRSRVEHSLADRASSCHCWLALKLLDEKAVRNVSDLARYLGVTTGGVTRIVDTLETKGWIERDRSAHDRREVLLNLTPLGRDEMRELMRGLVASWTEVLSVFADDEFEEFVRLVTLLRQRLETLPVRQMEAVR
jgi:DNA-binding MarR family transcriptional regulator